MYKEATAKQEIIIETIDSFTKHFAKQKFEVIKKSGIIAKIVDGKVISIAYKDQDKLDAIDELHTAILELMFKLLNGDKK